MNARTSIALIAAPLALLACAAQVNAAPHGRPYSQPAHAAPPPAAVLPAQSHVVHFQPATLPAHQLTVFAPVFAPMAFPALGGGLFGGSSLGLTPACSSRQGMTLGELAPGGSSGFAPVTQGMLNPAGTSSIANLLGNVLGSTQLGGIQNAGSQQGWQFGSSQANCPTPGSDLPSLDLGN